MGKSKKTSPERSADDAFQPGYHVPVLLSETVKALNIQPSGVYVDCTFGGGGHARAILEKLGPAGRLIAFDQDEDARRNLTADPRLLFIPENFRHVSRFLRLHKVPQLDGLMADLGVSSYQFDEASRGFSFRFDGSLDMRMDKRQTLTATDIVSTYGESDLHKMFEQYGEVTNSKTIAKTIVQARQTTKLNSIESFRNAIRGVVKGNPNKYFAQVFQALRIEVNDELGAVKELLSQVPALLKPGGRAAIITFHSLEDRLVKNFFRRGSFDEEENNPFMMVEKKNDLELVTKKPLIPGDEEMKINPRARSAKLRVAQRK